MSHDPQLARLGLFDARVPRYTSYPTAPHFAPEIGPGDFARWIRAIPEGSEISLYLHVPFCRRLCWFCACRTQGTATDRPLVPYLEYLKAELALVGTHRLHLVSVVQLYKALGGGWSPLDSAQQIPATHGSEVGKG